MLIPVILSGGVGSRLWPLSREHYPKQLLSLLGGQSFLQATALRLDGLEDSLPPLLVCNHIHRFLVMEQLHEIGIAPLSIVLEPVGRNTAPAVALAALAALERENDPVLLVLPADHLMQDTPAFQRAVMAGLPVAREGRLLTFGIAPERAETGYGYIRTGERLGDSAYQVAAFKEKPDAETAAGYLASGEYFWNSGIFMFRARRYLEELERHAPAILEICRRSFQEVGLDVENNFLHVNAEHFVHCPGDSIDYAVMEHTDRAAMIPLAAGWNDIGAWSALWEVSLRDEAGNVHLGDVLSDQVENSYLRAEHRLLAAVGVKNLVVVETADAVLVAHKDKVQDVKNIVSRLKQTRRCEADLHRKVYRPWGTYETLESAERFKVKRITVKPGASLSLQMHYHRSEHWVVVKGTARIVRDNETMIISENQSTYIPLGVRHRLENPGKLPLEIIEVQSGPYLEEDDIVRYEDSYGRRAEEC